MGIFMGYVSFREGTSHWYIPHLPTKNSLPFWFHVSKSLPPRAPCSLRCQPSKWRQTKRETREGLGDFPNRKGFNQGNLREDVSRLQWVDPHLLKKVDALRDYIKEQWVLITHSYSYESQKAVFPWVALGAVPIDSLEKMSVDGREISLGCKQHFTKSRI